MNAIGDAYLSASAIPILRSYWADEKNEIHFVHSSKADFLIKELDIDKNFSLKRKSIFNVINTIFNLRENEYDIVLCPFPGRLNSIFYSLCNGKKKSGFINFKKVESWDDKVMPLNINGENSNINWNPDQNFLKRVQLCLEGVDVKIKSEISKLQFPLLEDMSTAKNNKEYVLFHFNSRIPEKNISDELLIKIIEAAKKEIPDLKLLDKPDIINYLDDKYVESINTQSLKDLVNLVKNCTLFIGVDSFPIHIADAYNKKIICFIKTSNLRSILKNMENKYPIDIEQSNHLIIQQFTEFLNRAIH